MLKAAMPRSTPLRRLMVGCPCMHPFLSLQASVPGNTPVRDVNFAEVHEDGEMRILVSYPYLQPSSL